MVPGDGLYLKHVLPEQDGFYECQAISVVGSNRVVVKLNVHEAPRITRRPVKEVVVPLDGSTVLGMILQEAVEKYPILDSSLGVQYFDLTLLTTNRSKTNPSLGSP